MTRASGLGFSDDRHAGWLNFSHDDDHGLDTIQLHLKGGRGLISDDLRRFVDGPKGPASFGNDGSVSLYVTRMKADASADWEDVEFFDADRGWTMTHVPASQIEEVSLTRR